MSDRCNKCRYYSKLHFCTKHKRDAHSRDHVCREFKPHRPNKRYSSVSSAGLRKEIDNG